MKGSFSLDAFDPEINQQQASQILSAVDHRWSAFKMGPIGIARDRSVGQGKESNT
jgi:hypothetical protein